MLYRMRALVVAVFLLTCLVSAKEKKKPVLPDYLLNARTAAVIIDPNAGIPVSNPGANKTAQDDVEKALLRWGRINPVIDISQADLVIVVRKGSGKTVQPTVSGPPQNDRPVIVQTTDGGIRIGGQAGHPPDPAQGDDPQPTRRGQGAETGPVEDMFAVYEGRVNSPLDQAPAWRYVAKNALSSPNVPAVAELRKLIEEAVKQKKSTP